MGAGGVKKIVVGSCAILTACIIVFVASIQTTPPAPAKEAETEMKLLKNETVRELIPMWRNAAIEYMEKPSKKGTLIIQIPEQFTVFVPAGRGKYEGSETKWARVDSAMPITVTLMRDAEVEGDFLWEPEANRVDTLAIQ